MAQRKLVIGDIHGALKALEQCLSRAGYNPEQDTLICLGDVTDGWPQTRECIDLLLTLPNLVYIRGNHDEMALHWGRTGETLPEWLTQGGYATVESYNGKMPDSHLNLLENSLLYYELSNTLFVHAGIHTSKPLTKQHKDTFLWDRTLFNMAFDHRMDKNPPHLTKYDEIYIGHTPIHVYGYKRPLKACEVWMMDTGAGWDGVLSVMDIMTGECWTSDPVRTLYPEHEGRFKTTG